MVVLNYWIKVWLSCWTAVFKLQENRRNSCFYLPFMFLVPSIMPNNLEWLEGICHYKGRAGSEVKIAQSWPTLQPTYSPWNSVVQNTGVVAFPFSRGIFPARRTQVSHIAGGFFTSWATKEAQGRAYLGIKKSRKGEPRDAESHIPTDTFCAPGSSTAWCP